MCVRAVQTKHKISTIEFTSFATQQEPKICTYQVQETLKSYVSFQMSEETVPFSAGLKISVILLKRLRLGKTTGWQHRFFDLTILSPIWLGTYEYMKSSLENFFFSV